MPPQNNRFISRFYIKTVMENEKEWGNLNVAESFNSKGNPELNNKIFLKADAT